MIAPAWLERLLQAGPVVDGFLAEEPLRYLRDPVVEGDILRANFPAEGRSSGAERAVPVETTLAAPRTRGGEPATTCSCALGRAGKPCRHRSTFVGDVLGVPAFRAALFGSADPGWSASARRWRSDAARDLRERRVVADFLGEEREAGRAARFELGFEARLPGAASGDAAADTSLWVERAASSGRVLERLRVSTRWLGDGTPITRRAAAGARAADRAILAQLEPWITSEGEHAVPGGRAASLLASMSGAVLVDAASGGPLRVDHHPLRPELLLTTLPHEQVARRASSDGDGTLRALEARHRSDDGSIAIPARELCVIDGAPQLLWHAAISTLYFVDVRTPRRTALQLARAPSVELPETSSRAELRGLMARARAAGVTLPSAADLGLPGAAPPRFVLRVTGLPLALELCVFADYDGVRIECGAPSGAAQGIPDAERDPELESAALGEVATTLGLEAATSSFSLRDEAAAELFSSGLGRVARLDAPPVAIELAEQLGRVRVRSQAIRSRARARLGENWIGVGVEFAVEDLALELAALREAALAGARFVQLDDGSLARLGDRTRELIQGLAEIATPEVEGLRQLPLRELGRGAHLLSLADEAERDPRFSALHDRLTATEAPAPRVPSALALPLRPYQLRALAWLQLLAELGLGGVLADDMGLGKTAVALAALASLKETRGPKPSLVVCPTSVVSVWLAEAARFTPSLRLGLLHGAERGAVLARASDHDVLVTTYALLRRDVEELGALELRALVLDEAQNLKNAGSLAARAARSLRAEQVIALSGTPMENRPSELWSLMELCVPGLLGSQRRFEGKIERAVQDDPRGAEARALRGTVAPFVLRRTKQQVLSELPDKQEIVVPCPLGPEQRRNYDALAQLLRRELAGQTSAQHRFQVLTALLRLRQMAIDPRLVDPELGDVGAKLPVFLELVESLIAEGRRALVFSQFTSVLGLWGKALAEAGIEYEYLDGATRDRARVTTRFRDGKAPLFLISLKAGGSGLNLTAADTVVLCDPWWNPAVEAQATDRAHRMGQTRPVTVFRLIAAGTIEERITALQADKRALVDAVVGAESDAPLDALDADTLARLLADAS